MEMDSLTAGRTRWAARIFVISMAAYVLALIPNAVAGMPLPPVFLTKLLASIATFAAAPAFLFFVSGCARLRVSAHPVAARVALVSTVVFAATALVNRIAQMALLLGGPGTPSLDLYRTGSVANFLEMFAWDFCLGVAAASLSVLFAPPAEAWVRRLFALAGAVALLGEAMYLLSTVPVGSPATSGLGIAASTSVWVLLLPIATWSAANRMAERPESYRSFDPDTRTVRAVL